jgi:hypothetical protein
VEVVDLPHLDRPKKGRKINTFIFVGSVLTKGRKFTIFNKNI